MSDDKYMYEIQYKIKDQSEWNSVRDLFREQDFEWIIIKIQEMLTHNDVERIIVSKV